MAFDLLFEGDDWDEVLGLFDGGQQDQSDAVSESGSETTQKRGRKRSRRLMSITPEMQEWMLRLPFQFVRLRNAGDRTRLRQFLDDHVAPDVTMQTGNADVGEVRGKQAILKVIANELNVFPDCISVVEKTYLHGSYTVVARIVFRGTRTDRVGEFAPLETTEEGHDLHTMFFGSEELVRAQVMEKKLREGSKRVLTNEEVQVIRKLEEKVLQGQALAQIEVTSIIKWVFKLEADAAMPRIVRIEAQMRFRDISVYPVPTVPNSLG
jgi:hypothetical protein